MMILVRPDRVGGGRHVIAIFGVGLVGGAVVRTLRQGETAPPSTLPFSWLAPGQWSAQFRQIEQGIRDGSGSSGPLTALDVVWSAGPAGFGARHVDLEPELEAYGAVLEWAYSLGAAMPEVRLAFHLVSSAGGLFEGQRCVEATTAPRPLRPYGEAKLRQEDQLQDFRRQRPAHVYRPSSVYGVSPMSRRLGLLNTLVGNATRHASTRIVGELDTIRDYVFSSDVGAFIARHITQPDTVSNTYLLASGKPTSMTEILHIARDVARRPLYLKLDCRPSNARHIAYRPSALPADWRPTDLETGIRRMALQLAHVFEAGDKHSRNNQRPLKTGLGTHGSPAGTDGQDVRRLQ